MSKATQIKTTVIAKYSGKGAYYFVYENKIVQRGDELFLVTDKWCGDNLSGDCYRPAVYSIPAEARNAAVADVESNDLYFCEATSENEVDSVGFCLGGQWRYGEIVHQPMSNSRKYNKIIKA